MNKQSMIFTLFQVIVPVFVVCFLFLVCVSSALWQEGVLRNPLSGLVALQGAPSLNQQEVIDYQSSTVTSTLTTQAANANLTPKDLPAPIAISTLDVVPTVTPTITATKTDITATLTPLIESIESNEVVSSLPPTTLAPTPTIPPELVGGSALPERKATRLVVDALGLDAPVLFSPIKNYTWQVDHLDQELGHLEGTASPGTNSNIVLAGHVTLAPDGRAGPFYRLNQLSPGDEIIVYEGEQAFRYQVDYLTSVKPTSIEVTYPSTEAMLTLITCLNYDQTAGRYADRLVAVAHLVQN